ncbi:hypothetical protein ABT382_17115 [Streptomyces pharetrae]|uniref:hypothetical protein n=1 Tax=Streptomyces pharetrae TaxID=291370 RepID=UPI003356A21E
MNRSRPGRAGCANPRFSPVPLGESSCPYVPDPRRPRPLARAALGRAHPLTSVTRLRGGSRKGVCRLTRDDGSTAVACVWSPDEDHWDAGPSDPRDRFPPGTGLGLFTAAHARLTAAGVRTPRLLYADGTHTRLAVDAVVVDDLPGGSPARALERDPRAGRAALERLAGALARLRAHHGPGFGKVAPIDGGGEPSARPCERLAADGAPRSLAAAARGGRFATVRGEPPWCGSRRWRSGRAPGTVGCTASSARTTFSWTPTATRS